MDSFHSPGGDGRRGIHVGYNHGHHYYTMFIEVSSSVSFDQRSRSVQCIYVATEWVPLPLVQ